MSKHKTNPPCRICTRPTTDPAAVICAHCTDQLERALADVAAITADRRNPFDYTGSLTDDLDAFASGQDVLTGTGLSGRPAQVDPDTDNPDQLPGELPYERALRLTRELHSELVAAVRLLGIEGDVAANTPQALAAALLAHHHELIHHEAADEIATSITDVVRHCRETTDRPPERLFAGRCWANPDGCRADLWATIGAKRVVCTACGWSYEVGDVRDRLAEAARDYLGTATEVSAALTRLDQPISVHLISKWAERGRIATYPPHPTDPRNRPRYRIGDVENLLNQTRRETVNA